MTAANAFCKNNILHEITKMKLTNLQKNERMKTMIFQNVMKNLYFIGICIGGD